MTVCPNPPALYHLSPNFARLEICELRLWFSYQTLIAFQLAGQSLVIRENEWSTTTGRHLNAINADTKIRISSPEFARLWLDKLAPLIAGQ